jgi:hypothetical protein
MEFFTSDWFVAFRFIALSFLILLGYIFWILLVIQDCRCPGFADESWQGFKNWVKRTLTFKD